MRLQINQLAKNLAAGPAPVYLVSSDEQLLVNEAVSAIRQAVRGSGDDALNCDRESLSADRSFDWLEFEAGLQNLSLFASRRLIELTLPTGKPGDKGARFFASLAERSIPETVIVVITPALNSQQAKSKWVTSLARAGAWLPLYRPSLRELPDWIRGRLSAVGLTADQDAIEFLAAQIEGNLLAAQQEIDKLILLAGDGHVTLQTMRAAVSDGARFDVFQLSDAALAGEAGRAARILYHLEKEGTAAPLVLWSLARDIATTADIILRIDRGQPSGRAMNDAGAWSKRQNVFSRAIRGRTASDARALIASVSNADRIVKGARRGSAWNALLELVMLVSTGDQRWRAETA